MNDTVDEAAALDIGALAAGLAQEHPADIGAPERRAYRHSVSGALGTPFGTRCGGVR